MGVAMRRPMLYVWLLLVLLSLHSTSAALPPGYEDELYCPSEFCLRRKPPRDDGMVGGKSLFFECFNPPTGKVESISTWGFRLGDEAKQELVAKGFHTEEC